MSSLFYSNYDSGSVSGIDCNVPASIVTLSSYVELPAPSFQWNNAMEGTVFCQKVSCNEIVHWQCRDVPTVISGGRHQPPLR